jgi:hypothetical protein
MTVTQLTLKNHMDENLKSNRMGLKDSIKRIKNKFNEYWPKDYALICMILDPRFKLYFPINLNEKKEAKDLFQITTNAIPFEF